MFFNVRLCVTPLWITWKKCRWFDTVNDSTRMYSADKYQITQSGFCPYNTLTSNGLCIFVLPLTSAPKLLMNGIGIQPSWKCWSASDLTPSTSTDGLSSWQWVITLLVLWKYICGPWSCDVHRAAIKSEFWTGWSCVWIWRLPFGTATIYRWLSARLLYLHC